VSPAAPARPTGPAPVHLLMGPEEGEKAAFVDKIRQSLVARAGGEEQLEVFRFYGGEAQMAEVVRCLRNLSLFARHRLVIVGDVDGVKRAEDVAALAEYCGAPAPDATLLLLSSGLSGDVDRKLVGDQKKKSPGAVPFDCQKIFWEMFENQKQGWVTSFFRQKGITISSDAVEYILDMVENNTRDMRVECERLSQFFGSPADIGLENVEQYIYHSKEENVFTLFDRLCLRELSASEEILDKILLSREAEATQLAGGLLQQFRKLRSYKRMLVENYESGEAFTKLRIWSKKGQKTYGEGARRFSAEELEGIMQLLVCFDERFRSVKTDLHELLLRLMIYYIVQRAGQGAWRQSI
jgi:DNA polymerase-3 subunit delta